MGACGNPRVKMKEAISGAQEKWRINGSILESLYYSNLFPVWNSHLKFHGNIFSLNTSPYFSFYWGVLKTCVGRITLCGCVVAIKEKNLDLNADRLQIQKLYHLLLENVEHPWILWEVLWQLLQGGGCSSCLLSRVVRISARHWGSWGDRTWVLFKNLSKIPSKNAENNFYCPFSLCKSLLQALFSHFSSIIPFK